MTDYHIQPLNLKSIPKITTDLLTTGATMKDERTAAERIAEIRKMMEMVGELEVVRKKYGKTLRGGDTVNVTMPLDDLEIDVYGSFANMVETRLRLLEREGAKQ